MATLSPLSKKVYAKDISSITAVYKSGQTALRIDSLGSGFAYYPSGRIAACVTAVRDGLYSQFYHDSDSNILLLSLKPGIAGLGFWTSTIPRFKSSRISAQLMDEQGSPTQSWYWRDAVNLSLRLPLNEHLLLEVNSAQDVKLLFSCEGIMHSFELGMRDVSRLMATASSSLSSTQTSAEVREQLQQTKLAQRKAGFHQTFDDLNATLAPKLPAKLRETVKSERSLSATQPSSSLSSPTTPEMSHTLKMALEKRVVGIHRPKSHQKARSVSPQKVTLPILERKKLHVLTDKTMTEYLSGVSSTTVVLGCCLGSWSDASRKAETQLEHFNYQLAHPHTGSSQQTVTYELVKFDMSKCDMLRKKYCISELPVYLAFIGGKLVYAGEFFSSFGSDLASVTQQMEQCVKKSAQKQYLEEFAFSVRASKPSIKESTQWLGPERMFSYETAVRHKLITPPPVPLPVAVVQQPIATPEPVKPAPKKK